MGHKVWKSLSSGFADLPVLDSNPESTNPACLDSNLTNLLQASQKFGNFRIRIPKPYLSKDSNFGSESNPTFYIALQILCRLTNACWCLHCTRDRREYRYRIESTDTKAASISLSPGISGVWVSVSVSIQRPEHFLEGLGRIGRVN